MVHNLGVLALQGDVREHVTTCRKAWGQFFPDNQANISAVCSARDIPDLEGLIIPGGESTTISRLIDANDMRPAIQDFSGGIFGTCAGLVLMSEKIVDDHRFEPLGLIDISTRRNAFGGQKDSFERGLDVKGFDTPYGGIFIRAPVIESAGDGVDVLSTIPEGIVAVKQGNHMALAFHPELSTDLRFHGLFFETLKIS